MSADLIVESAHQWRAALRRMIRGGPAVETVDRPGLAAVWGNVNLPFYNHSTLTRPVADLDELRRHIDWLLTYAAGRGKPWMFTPADAWLPEGANDLLSSSGLIPAMSLTGMVAEAVAPVERQASHDIRKLSGRAGSRIVGDLNCAAYGMPLEWSAETDWPAFFGDDVFSYALYENDIPASTATVFVLDGCLNVVCVATPEPFQRKGYAEAVVRHALEQASAATGISRTVLHASRAGYPIYMRMGYQPVVEFTAWTPAQLYSHSA